MSDDSAQEYFSDGMTELAIRDISAPGSQLVFDYLDADALNPEKAAARMQKLSAFVRQKGEPFLSSFDPRQLQMELSQSGLQIREHLDPEEIQKRYSGYKESPSELIL